MQTLIEIAVAVDDKFELERTDKNGDIEKIYFHILNVRSLGRKKNVIAIISIAVEKNNSIRTVENIRISNDPESQFNENLPGVGLCIICSYFNNYFDDLDHSDDEECIYALQLLFFKEDYKICLPINIMENCLKFVAFAERYL